LGKGYSGMLFFMRLRSSAERCAIWLRVFASLVRAADYKIRLPHAVLPLAGASLNRVRRACFGIVASVLLVTWVAMAAQPSPDEARQLARDAERRMRELQAEADRLASQTGTLLGELRKLELERAIRAEAVRKADAELTAVNAALARTAAQLKALDAERVANTPGVQERLVEIYKRGRGGYLRLMLASDDLRALGRLSRGVSAVAELDRVRFDAHRRTIRAEQETMKELEARKAAVSKAQAEATSARRALDAALAAHNRRLDELDQRRDVAARYVGELETASAELQRHAAGLTSDTPAALPIAPFRGALDWPVRGRIVSRFGRTGVGTTITRNGVEIAAVEGQDVKAVHGGVVEFAAPFTGYGTLVIIDHGGNAFTLYGHLQHAAVSPGARVARGSTVGQAGRNPGGQQVVYFEVRIDGRPVDPVQWLRSAP
jgi:septal ring factor EnvC (AmiA/AmiB activator)